MENEYTKGFSQITSAVFHRLCSTDLEGMHTIRLMADVCGGQNRNKTVVGIVCTWLTRRSPENLKKVIITLHVVGYSFIPPDRIFGLVERQISSMSIIVEPAGYKVFK